jgi:hypothetical protein
MGELLRDFEGALADFLSEGDDRADVDEELTSKVLLSNNMFQLILKDIYF